MPKDREQKTNHQYGLMMIRKPRIPGLVYLLWPSSSSGLPRGFSRRTAGSLRRSKKPTTNRREDWNQEIFPVIPGALRRVLLQRGVPVTQPERYRPSAGKPLPVRYPEQANTK